MYCWLAGKHMAPGMFPQEKDGVNVVWYAPGVVGYPRKLMLPETHMSPCGPSTIWLPPTPETANSVFVPEGSSLAMNGRFVPVIPDENAPGVGG